MDRNRVTSPKNISSLNRSESIISTVTVPWLQYEDMAVSYSPSTLPAAEAVAMSSEETEEAAGGGQTEGAVDSEVPHRVGGRDRLVIGAHVCGGLHL